MSIAIDNDRHAPLVAIGASAGGPAALVNVLSHLPADFPAPIVIVQHVDSQFTGSLANWLANECKLRVRLARAGDHPQPGAVLLAGANNHLVFTGPGKLGYAAQPDDCLYRPSIDVFFRSIPRFWNGEVLGVLLTGMGRDGAEGLKTLREAGHHTIVQNQATCAVFGMPKAAVELRAAAEILPLDQIGPRLTTVLTQSI